MTQLCVNLNARDLKKKLFVVISQVVLLRKETFLNVCHLIRSDGLFLAL